MVSMEKTYKVPHWVEQTQIELNAKAKQKDFDKSFVLKQLALLCYGKQSRQEQGYQ